MKMHRINLPLFTVMAILLFSCSGSKNDPSRGDKVKDYLVLALTPKTVTVHNNFPATIEGQEVIEIRPMISGYIKEILVREGDRVKQGQLLFRISNPQYEQEVNTAKASVNSAMAEVNTAKMEVEKVRPLVEKQIVSNYRLTSAQLALEVKEAALEQARAALNNAQVNLGYTSIRSPRDGMIGTIPYKTGALVGSGSAEALTTLSDTRNIFAYFSWNEKQLLDFLTGAPGTTMEEKVKSLPEVSLILANNTEYPLKGKVELASGLISTETGSAILKATFANPDGLIRSGSSATVSIPEVKSNVMVVPQGATYELQDKRFIYTVGADNKVTATVFTSVPSDNGKFFFVTGGLKSGERVVIEGVASLKDGMTITPKDTNAVSFYGDLH